MTSGLYAHAWDHWINLPGYASEWRTFERVSFSYLLHGITSRTRGILNVFQNAQSGFLVRLNGSDFLPVCFFVVDGASSRRDECGCGVGGRAVPDVTGCVPYAADRGMDPFVFWERNEDWACDDNALRMDSLDYRSFIESTRVMHFPREWTRGRWNEVVFPLRYEEGDEEEDWVRKIPYSAFYALNQRGISDIMTLPPRVRGCRPLFLLNLSRDRPFTCIG